MRVSLVVLMGVASCHAFAPSASLPSLRRAATNPQILSVSMKAEKTPEEKSLTSRRVVIGGTAATNPSASSRSAMRQRFQPVSFQFCSRAGALTCLGQRSAVDQVHQSSWKDLNPLETSADEGGGVFAGLLALLAPVAGLPEEAEARSGGRAGGGSFSRGGGARMGGGGGIRGSVPRAAPRTTVVRPSVTVIQQAPSYGYGGASLAPSSRGAEKAGPTLRPVGLLRPYSKRFGLLVLTRSRFNRRHGRLRIWRCAPLPLHPCPSCEVLTSADSLIGLPRPDSSRLGPSAGASALTKQGSIDHAGLSALGLSLQDSGQRV